MGIKVKLDLVLARRNMTLTQLSERIGVTLANLSILKTGKGKAHYEDYSYIYYEEYYTKKNQYLELIVG